MPRDVIAGLGTRVRERRMAVGMKLTTLARRAGITASYLSEMETTEGCSPSAIVLCKIADTLEVSVHSLLGLPERSSTTRVARGLPPSLGRAKAVYRISDDEVELLSRIDYRGRRPQTDEDWFFLLCAVRRAVR